MNNIDKFIEDMKDNGIAPPNNIHADGNLHRFYIYGDNSGSKNGWYVYYDDDVLPVGMYGCWKRRIKRIWQIKNNRDISSSKRAEIKDRMNNIKRIYDKEKKSKSAKCRKESLRIWKHATRDSVNNHGYIKKKTIKPYAARINEQGNITIRLIDIHKKLHGLQFITRKGDKYFQPGTSKKKHFCLLGKDPEALGAFVVCEGWATGCSIHQATRLPVVVAFDAGNLKSVAQVWRDALPDIKIIIAGDDDHTTKDNPGKTKAVAAAEAVKGIAVFPTFKVASDKTDFNDMHKEQGIKAVKKIFHDALSKDPDDFYADSWPEPLLFGGYDTPEIPCTVLPEPLSGYCKAVSAATQTPTGLSVMTALSTISTCLQKRFEVVPFADDYAEPVNIMSVVALDSASRKTAVLRAMTEPLLTWEKGQEEALKDKISQNRHEQDMLIKSIDSIKSRASKPGTTEDERNKSLAEIKRLENSMPKEIVTPRLWVDDITIERLQDLMAENDERIAIISDEGGVFEVISGLYSGGKSNVNVILQSHSGSPVRVERQGRSVTLNKPAITLGLTVQPDIISDLAIGSKARFRGNGMLARLLFCLPKSIVGSRDITKHISVPDDIKAKYNEKISELISIKPLHDSNNIEIPRKLLLSSDALDLWKEFYQFIEPKQGQDGEFFSIRDWTGKLPGAVLRIAGLCHVVEYGKKNKTINKKTIKRAIKLATLLIPHAKHAFGMMGGDQAISDAKIVFQWIIKNGASQFRRGDLHKALHGRFQRVERLVSALKVLQERHIVSGPEEKPTGRRPEIIYMVNPQIFECNNMSK